MFILSEIVKGAIRFIITSVFRSRKKRSQNETVFSKKHLKRELIFEGFVILAGITCAAGMILLPIIFFFFKDAIKWIIKFFHDIFANNNPAVLAILKQIAAALLEIALGIFLVSILMTLLLLTIYLGMYLIEQEKARKPKE